MDNEKRTAVDDICDALVDLLFEMPLSKIKIKDIVDKAGINKSSYYYHFYSKEDVMDEIMGRFIKGLIEAFYSKEQSSDGKINAYYYFYNNRDIFMVLNANGYHAILHKKMIDALVEQYGKFEYEYTNKEGNKMLLSKGTLYELANKRYASSSVMYLEYWAEREFDLPIDMMVELSRQADTIIASSFRPKRVIKYE